MGKMVFGRGKPVVDGETRDPVQSPPYMIVRWQLERRRLETETDDAVAAEKRKTNKWKKRAMDMIYFNGDEKLLPRWAKYAKTQEAEWEALQPEENDFATRGEGAASGSGGEGAPAPASPRGPEHRAPVDIAPATRDWATSGCGGEGAPAPAPTEERPVGDHDGLLAE